MLSEQKQKIGPLKIDQIEKKATKIWKKSAFQLLRKKNFLQFFRIAFFGCCKNAESEECWSFQKNKSRKKSVQSVSGLLLIGSAKKARAFILYSGNIFGCSKILAQASVSEMNPRLSFQSYWAFLVNALL